MASLAILQADARVVARLAAALGRHHQLVLCADWDELERLLDGSTFDGCLVDVDFPTREAAKSCIGELHARHPATAIIA